MATTTTDPKPVLKPDTIYLGDNGRAFCRDHAGASALYTGRDLSGQKLHKVTDADQRYAEREWGRRITCEGCR